MIVVIIVFFFARLNYSAFTLVPSLLQADTSTPTWHPTNCRHSHMSSLEKPKPHKTPLEAPSNRFFNLKNGHPPLKQTPKTERERNRVGGGGERKACQDDELDRHYTRCDIPCCCWAFLTNPTYQHQQWRSPGDCQGRS